jgi:hypothetical protein
MVRFNVRTLLYATTLVAVFTVLVVKFGFDGAVYCVCAGGGCIELLVWMTLGKRRIEKANDAQAKWEREGD